jgi:hypothetical protein
MSVLKEIEMKKSWTVRQRIIIGFSAAIGLFLPSPSKK